MTGAVIGFVLFLITLLVVISLTWIPILGELAWALAGAELFGLLQHVSVIMYLLHMSILINLKAG